ncbi:hypothetical protein BU23DRAFT_503790 [Bimuria novae-zelandiae CBS 107.79]|uniref:Uncharacterized protein n=1 Tax=Bimuria novae-zelandiae CBS 107.79 TaxID=1447943 RepID=A0A6A5VH89_9PLEO|nr:hypothetical protein BU23DRAFT_503790 [Bimuria novae-zelandiae CBS 107.79]
MKLSWGFIASSLYCAAAAAQDGRVYILDPTPRSPPQASTTVDATTARLILAQRLGLSRFHAIEKTRSEESLKQINAFGGRQQKLFGEEDAGRTQAHALVWIEGVEDADAVLGTPESWTSSFSIAQPPSAADNKHLIEDMILQAQSLPQKSDPKGSTYVTNEYIDFHLSKLRQPQLFNDYLTVFHMDLKSKDKMARPSIEAISEVISDLQRVKPEENRFPITLVVMPPSSSVSKRAANPYGSYDRPNLQARARPLTEAPMTFATSEPATSPNTALPADMKDFPVITQAEGNTTTPPLGILPRCFDTQSACDKATNGCSGHGKCSVLHKGEKGKDGRGACYGCVCQPTVVDKGDTGMEGHKLTTYWGGPACQKQDVSVPFWLFFTSGLLFAFLIAGGIGLLYSVGSEELPSVIGAGVSGPVRK